MDLIKEIEDTEQQVSELKTKLTQLQSKATALNSLKNDLNFLKTKDKELPPGFEIKWLHRHDPFNSVYALYIHEEYHCMASDSDDEEAQQIKLRKKAWEFFDFACMVLKPILQGMKND